MDPMDPKEPESPDSGEELKAQLDEGGEAEGSEEEDASPNEDVAGQPEAAKKEEAAAPGQGELRITLTLRGGDAFLGVREGDVDPIFQTMLGATLESALAEVPQLLDVARLKWATQPKNPAYQRAASPTPTRQAPRPTAKAAAAKPQPAAPKRGQQSFLT